MSRTDADESLVSLEDVEVHFSEGSILDRALSTTETVRAVDGVSLEIAENDVVALVGESGCGKTTLGKAAVALQQPTAGSVQYRGQDVWDVKDGTADTDMEFSDVRQALQIIHQDPGSSLNPNRTVLSSLADPLKRWRPDVNTDDREGFILRMLERVGMTPAEDYANRYPHQLSGGEQQRVALSRALLMSPDLILADEAVSALDVSLRIEMMDLMLELRELIDTSFLFISHDFSNARYVTQRADGRIGVMYLGKLVEIGPAEEVIHNPKHPYTQVLSWATPVLDPEIARKTRNEQPPVRAIDVPDPKDPPSGCRFHTRCPEAREACTEEEPPLIEDEGGVEAACFRLDDDHEYWESEPLASEDEEFGESTAAD